MSIRKAIPVFLIFAGFWLAIRYMLPLLLPFVLAALLALAAEPLVGFFQKKLRLSRGVATGLGMTMTLVLLTLLVMVLVALLLQELKALAAVVPDLEDTAVQGMSLLEKWLLGLIEQAPQGIGAVLSHSVEGLFTDSTALLDRISTWLLGLASGIVSRLPDSALGFFTWLLACYMISAKLPRLRRFVAAQLPPAWNERYLPMLQRLKKSVFGWLKAQSKLIGITFLVLCAGFFILRISYAPVWAILIALIDALPVLGTGMVLVPWSVVCFLQNETARGIGLLGIYVAAMILRSVLEPRFVGKQLGLDPLLTLGSMYVGYRLLGIGGMIVAPLLAVIVTQFAVTHKNS